MGHLITLSSYIELAWLRNDTYAFSCSTCAQKLQREQDGVIITNSFSSLS